MQAETARQFPPKAKDSAALLCCDDNIARLPFLLIIDFFPLWQLLSISPDFSSWISTALRWRGGRQLCYRSTAGGLLVASLYFE